MILIVAGSEQGQQLAAQINQRCQCTGAHPQEVEAALRAQPEAIIVHWPSVQPTQDLMEALIRCGAPVIITLERSASGAEVAAELAAMGVRNFRFEDESSDWNGYLFQIIDAHRRQGIIQSTHEYLESLHLVQMERTRSVLDSLQMGLMVIEGASDGQLMHYNHRLELLLNRDLETWHGWTLSQIQKHLKEEEPSEVSLFSLPVQISDETVSDFFRRGPLYLQRTTLPLISATDQVTGYLLVFKDVTFEVSSDRLDSVTGLPTKTEVASLLSRRVAWTLRHSGIPCRYLATGHIRITDMDHYREHQGQTAVEELLLTAASMLRLCSSDSMVIVRSGISDFLIYTVDYNPEQCIRKHRDIRARLEALERKDKQQLNVQGGWAVRSVHESDFADPARMEDGLRRAFKDGMRTADKALQRAILDKRQAMLYTAEDGFIAF